MAPVREPASEGDRQMGRDADQVFEKAIRANFGCTAEPFHSEPIVETFEGETVWEGIVHTWVLHGHPEANRCYVWAAGDNEVVTVLHMSPVNSPLDAVRASILANEPSVPEAG